MSQKLKIAGGAQPPPCSHTDDPIPVGDHTIYAGGGLWLQPEDMADYDIAVFLRAEAYAGHGKAFGLVERNFLWLPIVDFKTVPEQNWVTWKQRIVQVAKLVTDEKRVIAFCAGGHGRTGLFLASVLAHMEPEHDDPVSVLRSRYCHKAVETKAQEAQVLRFLHETRAARTVA